MTDGRANNFVEIPRLALAAEWREPTVLVVTLELEVMRNELTDASEGLCLGDASIGVFDTIAEMLRAVLARAAVESDPEARPHSVEAVYRRDTAEVPEGVSMVAD